MNSHSASKYDFGGAFIHIANFLLLILGVGVIGFGAYQVASMDPGGISASISGWSLQTCVNSIVAGSLAVAAGLFGFIGLVMRHRLVVLVFIITLAVGAVIDVTSLIMLSAANRAAKQTVEDTKAVILTEYGSGATEFSKALTQSVDDYHRNNSCCGWSGSASENVFLTSPWYMKVNNATQPGGKALTYPKSCCVALSKDSDPDRCVRATDDLRARKLGYIYAYDCLERLLASTPVTYLRFSELVLLMLLQISSLFFAAQFLVRLFAQDNSPGSSSGRQQLQQQQQHHQHQQQQQQQQQQPDLTHKQQQLRKH